MDINELMERLNKIKEGQGDRSPSSDMDSKISALTSMGSGMDSDKFLGGLKEDTEEESIDPEFDKENDEYFKDVDDEISSDSVQPKTIPLPGSPPKPKVMYADSGQIKNDGGNYNSTIPDFETLKKAHVAVESQHRNVRGPAKHFRGLNKEKVVDPSFTKYQFMGASIPTIAGRLERSGYSSPELKELLKYKNKSYSELSQKDIDNIISIVEPNLELQDKLYEAEMNNLSKKYPGDLNKILMAYNQGEGYVNNRKSSDLEKENYVFKVKKALDAEQKRRKKSAIAKDDTE